MDLGASVNILPYSIYLQSGLGEIQDTRVDLQLAYSLVKVPKGIVKDVLVQVDGFVYPADFIVLDANQKGGGTLSMPIILGRPFLATNNARIHVRNGLMNLTFGNISVEVNIYNLMAQPNLDEDDITDADLLDALVQV